MLYLPIGEIEIEYKAAKANPIEHIGSLNILLSIIIHAFRMRMQKVFHFVESR
jgi:hypothetical protein